MKKVNSKGFTMVELLAVVVILGIVSLIGIASISRLVKNSRDHYYDTQSDQLVMAAKAYANADRSILPKMIGGSNRVYLKELKKMNYIKGDIFDQNKQKCDPDKSYVAIFKKNKTDYSYIGYLNCPSCKVKGNSDGYCDTNSEEVPDGEVILTVEKVTVSDGSQQDLVKTASGTLKMWGNNKNATPTKNIYSYSYKIYRDGVLVFSSGVKRVMGKSKTVNISSKLTENVPGKIKVVLTVTNEDGFSKTVSKSYNYKDVVAPQCGAATGEVLTKMVGTTKVCDDTAWSTSRDVWVICRDYKGSGCKMHEFSGHFTRDSGAYGTDTVYVEDLNGTKTPCTVYTCIDRIPPTLTVKVYKRLNGKDNVDDYKNEKPLKTFEVNSNDTSIHDLGWFNKDYDEGVFFAVTATDKAVIKSYKAEFNETGKYKNDAETGKFDKVASNSDNNIYKTSIKKADYLVGEGRRYIRFTVKDGAGNTSSLSFRVEIDRTSPKMTVNIGRCPDRTAACATATSLSDKSSVTVSDSNLRETVEKKTWVIGGFQIKYNIDEEKNNTSVLFKWDKDYSMTSAGSAKDGDGSTYNPTTSGTITLTGSGMRQGYLKATDEAGNSVSVTLNGYISNKCTIIYNSNGGVFNKAVSNTITLSYQDYLDNNTNLMRTVRGSGSYFYGTNGEITRYAQVPKAKYTIRRYVLSAGSEWFDGASYYNQNTTYHAQTLCKGMSSSNSDVSKTLSAVWLNNGRRITIYDWEYIEKKCNYVKNSKKKTDRPWRKYKFLAFHCACDFNDDSHLESKAFYKKHTTKGECESGPLYARVYYRKSKKGKKVCEHKEADKEAYPINTYVYQVCTAGHVDTHTDANGVHQPLWFHGAYWYWSNKDLYANTAIYNNSFYYTLLSEYWLINESSFRKGNTSKLIPYKNFSSGHVNSQDNASNLSYENDHDNRIQTVCKNYCTTLFGEYRTKDINPVVDEIEEDNASENGEEDDAYADPEEEDDD